MAVLLIFYGRLAAGKEPDMIRYNTRNFFGAEKSMSLFFSKSDAASRALWPISQAVLMTVLFGFDFGFMIAFKAQLINLFMLKISDFDVLMGTFILGTVVGTFFGGSVSYGSGRKSTLLGGFILGLGGFSTCLLARVYSVMLISQFVTGAALGIFCCAAFSYVTELSDPKYRPLAMLALPFSFLLGIFLVVASRDSLPDISGTAAAAVILCLGIFHVTLAALKMPESPRWLALAGFSDGALAVLLKLRGNSGAAARELALINSCCSPDDRGIAFFMRTVAYRRILLLLVAVVLLMHASGFGMVPYFALETISRYNMAIRNVPALNVYDYDYGLIKSTLVLSLLSIVCAVVAIRRLGPKMLLLMGLIITSATALCMLLIVLSGAKSAGALFLPVLILLFIFGASVFFYVFMTAVVCDILPLRGRDLGVVTVIILNSACSLLDMQLFHRLLYGLSFPGLMALFLCGMAALALLVIKAVPDTRDSLPESFELKVLQGRRL